MFFTASHAGCGSSEGLDAFQKRQTAGALIDKVPCDHPPGEGKIVTSGFVQKPDIPAGLLPFLPVGRDFTVSATMVSDQVSQFVEKGSFDFMFSKMSEAGVEDNL